MFGPQLLTEEIPTEPLDYGVFLRVPTGPGLGIHLDEAKLAHFRRDRVSRSVHPMPKLKAGA